MLELRFSLVIEATEDPTFFGFYSPDLEGFTGIGHSIEDCLYKAKWGMDEHVALLKENKLPIPRSNPNPTVTIQNELRRHRMRRSPPRQLKSRTGVHQ